MRSKRFSFAALMVAALLVLSFGLIAFAGCGNSEEEEQGGGESTSAAKFVTDTSLQDKLLAMYPFEEDSPSDGDTAYAYNPYTGEAITSANGEYVSSSSEPVTVNVTSLTPDEQFTLTGSNSTSALDSSDALILRESMNELYERDSDGNIATDNGFSLSFWAYNYEKDKTVSSSTEGSLAIDYANLVNCNPNFTITWGNISRGTGNVSYPDSNTEVGRAAYTDKYYTGQENIGSYYEAQPLYTTRQLEYFDFRYVPTSERYDYTGWNVISGNVQDAQAGSTVDVISEYCHNTWRYITLSVDRNGISFYMNGRLAYYYSADSYLPNWATNSTPALAGTSYYYRFIYALVGGSAEDVWGDQLDFIEDMQFQFDLFGYSAKAYVDDLIVGYALTEDEACALYENLSGVTYAAEDLAIASTMPGEARENAIIDALEAKEAAYESAATTANASADTLWDETTSARQTFLDGGGIASTKTEYGGYYEELGNTNFSSDWDASGAGGSVYYTPTVEDDDTFVMRITALQMSNATYNRTEQANEWANWNGVYATLLQNNGSGSYRGIASLQGSGGTDTLGPISNFGGQLSGTTVDATHDMTFIANSNTTGVGAEGLTFQEVKQFTWIEIELEWDGDNLVMRINYYYYYVGDDITLDGLTGDDAKYTIEMRPEAQYGTTTMTVRASSGDIEDLLTSGNYEMSDLAIRLNTQFSYLLVLDVEGGTASAAKQSA